MDPNQNEKQKTFYSGDFKSDEAEKLVLEFWEKNNIFEKTLDKTKDGKSFTFYDGPPFATGLPHYGHILASTIKDVIPRYQTMKGRFVRRRWGWDCHGLPIEEIVERSLGISGKKQIEEIGIGKFNAICREKVLGFADEWAKMVRRLARWVDFDSSYKTMDRDYMESVWWAFKQVYDKGLVYEGRKVLMYCPRCETPVSNFEVAMDNSYKDVTEETATVKFKVKAGQKIGDWAVPENTYILAWTTTPWTLPGNVALAAGNDIDYVVFYKKENKNIFYITSLAFYKKISGGNTEPGDLDPDSIIKDDIVKGLKGIDLINLEYEPLFDVPAMKNERSYKVYAADFVSTEEGTGIVHIAPAYGEDDYNLGIREGLPVVPMLDSKGLFNDKAPEFLRGQYFKKANALVFTDLENRSSGSLIFKKESHTHSYPHCWRCGTPLYYNAIPAWFINIQKIKGDLVKSNDKEINWFPEYLKHGRYEKSVEAAPDWNISRNRYWGNPIPVWRCDNEICPPIVVGSIKELGLSTNTFYFSRHGEARQNVLGINSCYPERDVYDLTEAGVSRAKDLVEKLKSLGGVDIILASDLLRTKRTAEIVGEALGIPVEFDDRLREYNVGIYNNRPLNDFGDAISEEDRWTKASEGGETITQVQERALSFIKETDTKYKNKKILVVSHGHPLWVVQRYYGSELPYPKYADLFKIDIGITDLHRPGIDNIVLKCPKCGRDAHRIKEIFDSWVEAGSMPFAEYHYPFDQKETFESRLPAQFVAEYIAQTRAWFYVMHVMSLTLFGKAPFENVVTTGTILAEDGSKMSKSKGNYPDPWGVIEKYGVDALRFYLMNSIVMQADNFNFSVKDLEVIQRRVVAILWNVYKYFETYANEATWKSVNTVSTEPTLLDRWIIARTKELVSGVTNDLDGYDTVHATRTIMEYVDDLSTWYLRRSRGRKDGAFFETLYKVLKTVSQVIAPFMPYLGEIIYLNLGQFGNVIESVHLTDWPVAKELNAEEKDLLRDMASIREAASVGQAARKSLNIPVRQPLPRLAFLTKEEMTPSVELMKVLLDELNVKKFDSVLSSDKSDDVKVFPGTVRILNLYLDTVMSEDLILEGLVRGLERAIQGLRKKQGLKVGEMATLIYATDDVDLKKAMGLFNREKTYVSKVEEGAATEEFMLDGKKISLALNKSI